jgi:hypothetical protein
MNQIKDPPLDSDFGYQFNYANWVAGTRVSLVNVPWNNDYRDVVRFANRAALSAYITSLEVAEFVIDDMIRLKVGEPVRIDLPFNSVYRFNYLRVSNPVGPIPGDIQRDYYYFINDVREIAPNTTELVLQLDVWQSFVYDITLGNCYIERGHIGIANENGFDAFGRNYLTIPEGLDIGGEYMNIHHRNIDVMRARKDEEDYNLFSILIVSTVDLTADAGTIEAPVLKTAKGGNTMGMPNGADVYILGGQPETSIGLLFDYLSDKPWVSQGIVSISVVPPPQNYGIGGGDYITIPGTSISLERLNDVPATSTPYDMITNWRNHAAVNAHLTNRYKHLKKMLVYPYTILELTTFEGKPIILKPEAWAEPSARVNVRVSYAPPHMRMVISPRRYNAKADSSINTWQIPPVYSGPDRTVEGDDGGDFLDVMTMISDFPSFAIVNNMGIAFLAGNANQLAFSRQSADWAQQRALRGSQVAYDQATGAMDTARALTDLGNTADYAQTMLGNSNMYAQGGINALGSIAGGTVQGGLGGAAAGPGGAAIGAGMAAVGNTVGSLFGAMGTNQSAETAARAQSLRAAANQAGNIQNNKQAGLIRDTNRDLSQWAAKGDYENSIAGINAKTQDAALTQPSTSGQIGGNAFNIINRAATISLRIKMLDSAALAVVGEYWLRYGYAVRRFGTIPANLMAMTKFTYWKLLETYISGGPMPEGFKQAIRGIFEKGVTVWADPADIGNIDIADNEPLEGIVY